MSYNEEYAQDMTYKELVEKAMTMLEGDTDYSPETRKLKGIGYALLALTKVLREGIIVG